MAEFHKLGKKGEEKAVEYIRSKGYKILHRNWKAGQKEIDIVAETMDFIVFIEVKTRDRGSVVETRDLITRDKQRFLQFAADSYIRKFNICKDSRFDIIVIKSDRKDFSIEHIENAFYPTLR